MSVRDIHLIHFSEVPRPLVEAMFTVCTRDALYFALEDRKTRLAKPLNPGGMDGIWSFMMTDRDDPES